MAGINAITTTIVSLDVTVSDKQMATGQETGKEH